jgi:NADPH:quinone reductase-like Zn-dependent oxidoreductase
MLGRWLRGRRVACGGHDCSGTWAEYCLVGSKACLPLAKQLTLEQGAAALANPTTALALASLVARGKHRAYVQTAAAGQLGKMILRAARDRGIEGIHVVRRAEQAEALRALDAKHVLVSSTPSFAADLRARAAELGATIALDAIAGDMTGTLVTALPKESEIVIYGALSGKACGEIDPMALAFRHQRVRGFEIAAYIEDLGLLRAFRFATKAQRYVRTGKFTTTIAATVPLAEAPARLAAYIDRMSDGKLLLAP